jgi:hypothetical protein
MYRKAFLPYGDIENVEITPGKQYGFVNFYTEEAATAARLELQVCLLPLLPVGLSLSHTPTTPTTSNRGP